MSKTTKRSNGDKHTEITSNRVKVENPQTGIRWINREQSRRELGKNS